MIEVVSATRVARVYHYSAARTERDDALAERAAKRATMRAARRIKRALVIWENTDDARGHDATRSRRARARRLERRASRG